MYCSVLTSQQDFANARDLLAPSNRNAAKLNAFAEEIARVTTHNQIPDLTFERNHHGEEDIAMFDFTSMSMANHSCYVKSRDGRTLIQSIVGDTLLEVCDWLRRMSRTCWALFYVVDIFRFPVVFNLLTASDVLTACFNRFHLLLHVF